MNRAAAAAIAVGSSLLVCAAGSTSSSQAAVRSRTGAIAVTSMSSIPGLGLYRFEVSNGHLTRLTGMGAHWVTWSRDGKRLAFVDSKGRLHVMNSDGGNLHAVGALKKATSASWGPGNKIAFGDGKGISVVKPDGTGLKRLRSSGDEPAWSPNGRTILFSWPGHGLYAMRAGGGGTHAVIKKPPPSGRHLYILSTPAWSPSGKKISFLKRDLLQAIAGPIIVSANADGSRQRVLAKIRSSNGEDRSTWSPDGGELAFTDLRGEQQGVFAVPSSGGKPRLLLGGGGTIWGQASWGPAGP